jgi:hypothetical protein
MDDVLEPRPAVRLDPLDFGSVHSDYVYDALLAREHFRCRSCGLRPDEYADQARALLLRECAGELQDSCSLGATIDEDHDFAEFGSPLADAQGSWLRRRPPHLLVGHS